PYTTLCRSHCDNCGCDWLDNGLNPIGCPYCKLTAQSAEIEALRAEVEEWKDVARCASEQQDSLFREARALSERADKLRAERDTLREALKDMRQVLEVLSRAHRVAMEQTLKARIPECGEFAGIAQDLDFVVAALRERIGEVGRNDLRKGDQP